MTVAANTPSRRCLCMTCCPRRICDPSPRTTCTSGSCRLIDAPPAPPGERPPQLPARVRASVAVGAAGTDHRCRTRALRERARRGVAAPPRRARRDPVHNGDRGEAARPFAADPGRAPRPAAAPRRAAPTVRAARHLPLARRSTSPRMAPTLGAADRRYGRARGGRAVTSGHDGPRRPRRCSIPRCSPRPAPGSHRAGASRPAPRFRYRSRSPPARCCCTSGLATPSRAPAARGWLPGSRRTAASASRSPTSRCRSRHASGKGCASACATASSPRSPPGSSGAPRPVPANGLSQETRAILSRAPWVGRWLADAGSGVTVFALIGPTR